MPHCANLSNCCVELLRVVELGLIQERRMSWDLHDAFADRQVQVPLLDDVAIVQARPRGVCEDDFVDVALQATLFAKEGLDVLFGFWFCDPEDKDGAAAAGDASSLGFLIRDNDLVEVLKAEQDLQPDGAPEVEGVL